MKKRENTSCLILEDEYHTAQEIKRIVLSYRPGYQIIGPLESCMEFSMLLSGRTIMPDLIISDVQLADGISTKVFEAHNLKTPVIFTAARDADLDLTASFNTIGRIRMPVTYQELVSSIWRFEQSENNKATKNPNIL